MAVPRCRPIALPSTLATFTCARQAPPLLAYDAPDWRSRRSGAPRLRSSTEGGFAALDEWAAVMKERARLVAEFDPRCLQWVTERRLRGPLGAGA